MKCLRPKKTAKYAERFVNLKTILCTIKHPIDLQETTGKNYNLYPKYALIVDDQKSQETLSSWRMIDALLIASA